MNDLWNLIMMSLMEPSKKHSIPKITQSPKETQILVGYYERRSISP